jgi:VRR-NUC domain
MPLSKEQIAQINIINWFGHNFPELADDLHHFANERKCSFMEGRILKRMGVKKGVADFFLAYPQHGYAGLWIELKVGTNKLTKDQQQFLHRKRQNGYCAIAAYEEKETKETFLYYLSDYITERAKILQKICAIN